MSRLISSSVPRSSTSGRQPFGYTMSAILAAHQGSFRYLQARGFSRGCNNQRTRNNNFGDPQKAKNRRRVALPSHKHTQALHSQPPTHTGAPQRSTHTHLGEFGRCSAFPQRFSAHEKAASTRISRLGTTLALSQHFMLIGAAVWLCFLTFHNDQAAAKFLAILRAAAIALRIFTALWIWSRAYLNMYTCTLCTHVRWDCLVLRRVCC